MSQAAEQCREYIEAKYPGVRISRQSCRNTASGGITQHSAYQSGDYDSNALDIMGGPIGWTWDQNVELIQQIVDDLTPFLSEWSIRKILWKVPNHFGHAHIDFLPMIDMRKWCATRGITPPWKYSDGHTERHRDPEPENGRYEGEHVTTHFTIDGRFAEYEEVSWLLFLLGGGTVDPNRNSSQVESVLGKTDVRLVTANDFDLIATHTGMNSGARDGLDRDGLYRWGKEIAALRETAYNA